MKPGVESTKSLTVEQFRCTGCEILEINNDERSILYRLVPTAISIDNRAINVAGIRMNRDGWPDEFRAVLFSHMWEVVVAKPLYFDLKPKNGRPVTLDSKAVFAKDDLSDEIYQKVLGGFINGVSPGFMPPDFLGDEVFYGDAADLAYEQDYGKEPKRELSKYHRTSHMIEYSIAPIQAFTQSTRMSYEQTANELNYLLHGSSDRFKSLLIFSTLKNYIEKVDQLNEQFQRFLRDNPETLDAGGSSRIPGDRHSRSGFEPLPPVGEVRFNMAELDGINQELRSIFNGSK